MTQVNPKLLEGLNISQTEAVLATEGRILVLAGAGSGKTRVLTTRIAYLLEEGIKPWEILAITFTNKASKEMKERVAQINPLSHKSWIGTFHSICNRILSANLNHLGIEKYTLMDESDMKAAVKAACTLLGIDTDKKVISAMVSQISKWKNDGLSVDEAHTSSHNNKILIERANVYQQYEMIKDERGYFDFDDLILKTIRLFFNNPEVLERYQNSFRYVMIDEFQDTNKIQFNLIEMLSGRYKNVFLVGDPDQSVYSFRSARIENILEYQEMHPETVTITLKENYRSTSCIVNASNALVENNIERLDREAISVGQKGDNIQVLEFNDASREADFVASLINNIKSNESKNWKDFAIMYRMNFQALHIEMALRDAAIPYQVVGSTSFYDRVEVKNIVSYIRTCHNLSDDYAIQRIINVPKRTIGETTVRKIADFAADRRITFYQALQNIDDVATEFKINKPTVKRLKVFTDLITGLAQSVEVESFSAHRFVTTLLKETDFMNQFDREKEEDLARIQNISHFRDFTAEWDNEEYENASLAKFVSEISLDTDEDEEDHDNKVTLTSVHSAKGLEWNQVFVIGMEDDVFPHVRSKAKPKELEEERRLMYVAMTRAENRLVLSYSRYKFAYSSQRPIKLKPSPFISEIPNHFKTHSKQIAKKK